MDAITIFIGITVFLILVGISIYQLKKMHNENQDYERHERIRTAFQTVTDYQMEFMRDHLNVDHAESENYMTTAQHAAMLQQQSLLHETNTMQQSDINAMVRYIQTHHPDTHPTTRSEPVKKQEPVKEPVPEHHEPGERFERIIE